MRYTLHEIDSHVVATTVATDRDEALVVQRKASLDVDLRGRSCFGRLSTERVSGERAQRGTRREAYHS